MAQSVKLPTSAQVIISQSVSSSPASGCVLLTAQSLEPASDSVSPLLSAPPPLALCLSKINKHFLKKGKKKRERGSEGSSDLSRDVDWHVTNTYFLGWL